MQVECIILHAVFELILFILLLLRVFYMGTMRKCFIFLLLFFWPKSRSTRVVFRSIVSIGRRRIIDISTWRFSVVGRDFSDCCRRAVNSFSDGAAALRADSPHIISTAVVNFVPVRSVSLWWWRKFVESNTVHVSVKKDIILYIIPSSVLKINTIN